MNKKFEDLNSKYSPIVKSLWKDYYVEGMDFDDWNQEASIVLFKIMYRFNNDTGSNFGSFYKSSLKNRLYDLIRKSNAKKRKPDGELSSLDSLSNNRLDMLIYKNLIILENKLFMREEFETFLLNDLSALELLTFKLYLKNKSEDEISKMINIDLISVKNALQRCRRKLFNKLNRAV